MKKARVAWMLAAVVTLNGFALAPAHAMTLLHCTVEGKCGGNGNGGGGDGNGNGGGGDNGGGGNAGDRPTVSVPEPGTLMLLATGFGAAGFAAWRRRRKKA